MRLLTQQVYIGELRGAQVFVREVGALVEFHVRNGVVAAAKAPLGHWDEAGLVAESEDEQGIDAADRAERIQESIDIPGQRESADLDADDWGGLGVSNRTGCRCGHLTCRLTGQRRHAERAGNLQRIPTRGQVSGHAAPPLRVQRVLCTPKIKAPGTVSGLLFGNPFDGFYRGDSRPDHSA